MNCKYCQGDREGFVNYLPKMHGKGNAYLAKGNDLGFLKVSAPYGNAIAYRINYCPMCGRKLV